MNIYAELTRCFNAGRTRAMLSGGQAVVLHRLAIMSKDGDWVVREDTEALGHILPTLEKFGARYRFGAPFDCRWMSGGWISHFEFRHAGLRVRTDFVTRPPRLDTSALARLWQAAKGQEFPAISAREPAETKKTNREKDDAVIVELARIMPRDEDRILCSRSARDLLGLRERMPDLFESLTERRPALRAAKQGMEELEIALDAERRILIHAKERRLAAYMAAAGLWAEQWPTIEHEIAAKPLLEAHRVLCARAEGVLPFGLHAGGQC